MPENDTTPAEFIALAAREMAADLERFGLWTGGPNFIDPASERLDVPAAAYKATTGSLPFVFALPDADAADTARAYIERHPAVMDTLRALAAYLARHRAAGLTGAELTAYRRGETLQDPAEYADAATREDLRTPDDDVRALVRIAAHFTTADAGKDPSPSWT